MKNRLENLYTREQIEALLDEHDNREIAELAQIPEKIVFQIREEKELRNTIRFKDISILSEENKKEIINLVALGNTSEEIATKMNCKRETIQNMKFTFGMYSRLQIVLLLRKYDDDNKITIITKVDAEVVHQIREESEMQTEKNSQKGTSEKRKMEIRRMTALGIAIEEQCVMLNLSSTCIKKTKERLGAYSRIQILQLLELGFDYAEISYIAEIDEEIIKQIVSEIRKNVTQGQKDLRDELTRLNGMINGKADKDFFQKQRDEIAIAIQTILKQYQQFFTSMDYAFITYAYIKIKDTQKAKDIAQRYLNLEDTSNKGLSDMILKTTGLISREISQGNLVNEGTLSVSRNMRIDLIEFAEIGE